MTAMSPSNLVIFVFAETQTYWEGFRDESLSQ